MSNTAIAARFDEIYNSTSKEALAFITARCGRTADISDIFQETYTDLYTLLIKRGTEYVTHERALVLRIAKRKLSKHYSFLERLKNFTSINYTKDNKEEDPPEHEAADFSTEDFAVDHIMLENAKQLIKSKPEDVRKIFYLKYYMGLSIPEIAQMLFLNESTVKNKLYRTIKELRRVL